MDIEQKRPTMSASISVPEQDHEGQMAKSELYRAAKMSIKLFQMIQDGQNLEGWVQSKITKAADYLDSVYHYMEYQMKFGDGSVAKSVDDITGEARSQEEGSVSEEDDEKNMKESTMNYEQKLKALLENAIKEEMKVGDTKKSSSGGTIEKTKTGVKHTAKPYDGETHTEPAQKKASKAGMSGAERRSQSAADKAEEKKGKEWEKKHGKGSVTRVKDGKKVESTKEALDMNLLKASQGAMSKNKKDAESDKNVKKPYGYRGPDGSENDDDVKQAKKKTKTKESLVKTIVRKVVEAKKKGAKPDFLDMDKDGNKKEPMKKAIADKKVKEASHQAKTTMKHIKNPTAGEKKAAKDIKPGVKGYSDRAAMLKSAEKDGRLKESAELSDILKLAGRASLKG